MSTTVIHLRSESKPLERRSPLSPASVKALLEAGYVVHVERSPGRIYRDEEFEAVGAEMVPEGSWPNAPKGHIIAGLKELPDDGSLLPHTHIQFGHCYKNQDGWAEYLSRFANGGGTLYDIEFLTNETGRRVAAFGYWAGYAGAAIALLALSHQLLHPGTPLGAVPAYDSAPELITDVKSSVAAALPKSDRPPQVIVIGALGRCGNGAIDLCRAAGVPESSIVKWDMAETAKGGPFQEIAESDIFINCVYLGANKIPPFVTFESLSKPGRRLRVICDVSLDPNNPNNPVPVYKDYTTFPKPTLTLPVEGDGPELTVISIDHLPTLVAREASDEFSSLLLPSLLALNSRNTEGVWTRAEKLYKEKVKELPQKASN
ncbi:saccharopine dehydrogenase [Diplogelasinospora grovesii]|uniref:Saccharopine dehydrogenase [NAD(+), L-lysine-forming] n=1 Tax=Diplogelasinospora grovesii TaxID=303347 RepID=A0AAN6S6J8_9PEZI|nr:saccharopine dehydrogenase [Diplogelasinospora grovesii]